MAEAEKAIPTARREESDVTEMFIWSAFPLLLLWLIAIALFMWWLFPRSMDDQTIRQPLPTYPAPRLQPSPRADMKAFYAEEMRHLNSTGWIDKSHGVAHIPIGDAVRKVVAEGIKGWPTASGKGP